MLKKASAEKELMLKMKKAYAKKASAKKSICCKRCYKRKNEQAIVDRALTANAVKALFFLSKTWINKKGRL